MGNVDKIIFDALAKHQNIVLPEVGSLEVKRRQAKRLPDNRIIPPQNVVVFNPAEIAEGESVVNLLGAAEDGNDASAVYKSWLDRASTDNGISIDGVGEIKYGKFVAAPQLHSELNPTDDEIVLTDNDRKGGPLWAWVLGGILLAALVLGVYTCWKCGMFDRNGSRPTEVIETVVPPTVPDITPEPDSTALAAKPGLANEKRFHVIAGSFAVESNADNYIKKLRAEHPELTIEKIYDPATGYNMVSIMRTSTLRQANSKISLYWDIDLGIWVYEEK